MRLEIGGGSNRREGYDVNMDVTAAHATPGFVGRLQDGVPLPDCSVERAYASHIMEHIPKQNGELLAAMNEVHRVLAPGGEFEIIVPCIGYTNHAGLRHVPDAPGLDHGATRVAQRNPDGAPVYAGWQGWADPTHVTFWWYPESFWYFTGGPAGNFRAHADYGIRYWNEQSSEIRDGWEAHVVLVKPQEGAA